MTLPSVPLIKSLACCGFCVRYFNTSPPVLRTEKVFRKLLGGSTKKKHRYSNTDIMPATDIFGKRPTEGKKSDNHKRISVLNKLFMRHITDLMATGQSASELLGHGIEVNKVKVTPDYNAVRIYWVSREVECADHIEKLLQKNAGVLRHELSQLRVMGVVPKLIFIKDKQHAEIMEIDARLARADFGEEYTPVDLADKLKSQLELHTELDEETKEIIEKSEEIPREDELPLPLMVQDVLGLNHADILHRVKKLMKKSEALHRVSSNKENQEAPTNLNVNVTPFTYPDSQSERAAFREFLNKRQLLQSKMKSRDKNYTPDMEYIRQELEENSNIYINNMLELQEKENDIDYIIEDDETENK